MFLIPLLKRVDKKYNFLISLQLCLPFQLLDPHFHRVILYFIEFFHIILGDLGI